MLQMNVFRMGVTLALLPAAAVFPPISPSLRRKVRGMIYLSEY